MVFIFSLRQSEQPLSGNPSALPHCSSLWAATKGGNAGRGGKREWVEQTNFLGSSPLFVPLSPSFRVEEGLGLVSVCPTYESARSSKGELLFRMKEKKKKKRRIFSTIFSSYHRLRFCFHRDVFWNRKEKREGEKNIFRRKLKLRWQSAIQENLFPFQSKTTPIFFFFFSPDFCIVLRRWKRAKRYERVGKSSSSRAVEFCKGGTDHWRVEKKDPLW